MMVMNAFNKSCMPCLWGWLSGAVLATIIILAFPGGSSWLISHDNSIDVIIFFTSWDPLNLASLRKTWWDGCFIILVSYEKIFGNCCEILPVLARHCNPTSAFPLPSSGTTISHACLSRSRLLLNLEFGFDRKIASFFRINFVNNCGTTISHACLSRSRLLLNLEFGFDRKIASFFRINFVNNCF
ncbi:hypothetical protein C1H46_016553 [Malus baccata]|uniref:Uncharacterized protein n=1 Tax=Malus baccata TaxID=106549 RepID=A0A540MGG8_MALBA|nr:hypothetical protein C1H46_016553 [Malus baccata]